MTSYQIPWRQFRKKPVMVDAFRWWGESVEGFDRIVVDSGNNPAESYGLVIPTLEGTMRADEGDWIIRGVAGEIYPCKDPIFRSCYESVEL